MEKCDFFKNNKYASSEWSAPLLRDYDAIRKQFESFDLVGKKIRRAFLLGKAYNLLADMLEEMYYNSLLDNEDFNSLDQEEKIEYTQYKNISNEAVFKCFIEHDEPLIFDFYDNDRLEVCAAEECCFRFSKNRIPKYINGWQNFVVDVNELFNCGDKTIVAIEINKVPKNYESKYLPGASYLSLDKEDDYKELNLVENIIIRLDDGSGIKINGDLDFSNAVLVDNDNKPVFKTFFDLKKALYNWEECNCDFTTGFETKSKDIYFGNKGELVSETPNICLSFDDDFGEKYIVLNNSEFDFDILQLLFNKYLDYKYDIYEDFKLDISLWNNLLNDYDIINNSKTFDEYYNNVITTIPIKLNGHWNSKYEVDFYGSDLWNNIIEERNRLNDLLEFTKKYSRNSDYIYIYGC